MSYLLYLMVMCQLKKTYIMVILLDYNYLHIQCNEQPINCFKLQINLRILYDVKCFLI